MIPQRTAPLHVVLFVLLCSILSSSTTSTAKTIRYRPGTLSIIDPDQGNKNSPPPTLARYENISVADARKQCINNIKCVTFSYRSKLTRFPSRNVTAYLFAYADWHVLDDGSPAFVEDVTYHSYVNVTREKDAVVREVGMLIELLMKIEISGSSVLSDGNGQREASRLRRRSADAAAAAAASAATDQANEDHIKNRKLLLLQSMFEIVYPPEHRLLAAPLVVPWALALASSEDEADEVREDSLSILMVIADGQDTLPMLVEHDVYSRMKSIIEKTSSTSEEEAAPWNTIRKKALDVISNICIHRSVNAQLSKQGAHTFLRSLLAEPGFAGLQATLALTHFSDTDFDIGALPEEKVDDMVDLMRNAIDGDVVYDNKWELVPGPLSAVKYLVFHGGGSSGGESSTGGGSWVYDRLLQAGLMEQLLRVLEDECLDPSNAETALEVLWGLVRVSDRARHMIVMAEHSIQEAEMRLAKYDKASKLASGLVASAANYYGRIGEEL